MIILEKPYVSEFLKETIERNGFKVLDNEVSREMGIRKELLTSDNEIINSYATNTPLYTNSENSINWVTSKLKQFPIAGFIDAVKNKYKFRQLIKEVYPNFYFQEFNIKDIDKVDVSNIKFPVIVKPSVGFLSLGVYRVACREDWEPLKKKITEDIDKNKGIFPEVVYKSDKFIIEEYIAGDEFAVDAYFDNNGEPVILNIFHHIFSSDDDVSDRLYMSSKRIINENMAPMTELLVKIGKSIGLKQFPLHIEVRKRGNDIIPIEINPMRFAGFCLTDNSWFGYGINSYEYYLKQQKPDWNKLLEGKDELVYTFIVLDMPANVNARDIQAFNYEGLKSKFHKVLDLRRLDYTKYNMFGTMFTESPENSKELDYILRTDLKEFII